MLVAIVTIKGPLSKCDTDVIIGKRLFVQVSYRHRNIITEQYKAIELGKAVDACHRSPVTEHLREVRRAPMRLHRAPLSPLSCLFVYAAVVL